MATDDRSGHGIGQALTPPRTIFARSTGSPPAAIAVIRISGPDAGPTLDTLIRGPRPQARRATQRRLYNPADGAELDSALVLWFPGPRTATGEDLAELHLHGGRAVVAAMESVLARQPGLTPAEPGAFTRRAFENGRIDLSQAEGLADLLEAETEGQRRAALTMAEGGLRRLVNDWQARTIDLASAIEAMLDFSDEADVAADEDVLRASALALSREVSAQLANPPAERLRDGVRVGIAGPPNAGKSTLLNRLAGREAAITSNIPGTTRDLIEVPLVLRGVPFLLIDTAGLREGSEDPIERLGIERAQAAIMASDIVLWMGDLEQMPDHPRVIALAAKSDLGVALNGSALAISSQSGEGVPALIDTMISQATDLLPRADSLALSGHQRASLHDAATGLSGAAEQSDLILAAEELRRARAAFDRITGMADVEAVLDALFGRFCIGK